jgi:predicted transposase YdaD
MICELEKELSEMCNLSEGIRESGRQEGIEIGRQLAIELTMLEDLRKIMKKLNMSFEEAADLFDIAEEDRAKYAAKV